MFTYPKNPSKRAEEGKTINQVWTPPEVATALFRLTKHLKAKRVLDPGCGIGNLLRPWAEAGCHCVGIDKDPRFHEPIGTLRADFYCTNFENFSRSWDANEFDPDLVVCNPPWSAHWQNANYAEVFLRKIVSIYGNRIPIIFLCPMGFRLNQRIGSERAKWLSETLKITSIISCPADLYKDQHVETHNEILLFNIRRVQPHYWLHDLPRDSVPRPHRPRVRTQVSG